MKLAILIIATNNYVPLLRKLVASIDEFFLPELKKDIFIFSDVDSVSSKNNNIRFIKIEHRPWPSITLSRFSFFSSVSSELETYDHVIYFDSDMEVVKPISSFCFDDYFGVMHPAMIFDRNFWTVETNKQSLAFLPAGRKGNIYYQGCLWGGTGKNISVMSQVLSKNIEEDLSNNIIAVWHDESHLNKYFYSLQKRPTALSPSYCFPEKWKIDIDKIIIHKDKNMIDYPRFKGGHA